MDWGVDWDVMEGDGQDPDLWREEATEGDQGHQALDLETTRGSESRGLGGVLDHIWKNPIGVTINPASLCPPPLDAVGASGPGSSWALLDLKAYIAARRNATTAKGSTRAGHDIQATLCIGRLPRVSHLCIHCPALTPADFGTEPAILATCDGFIFFSAAICNTSVCYEQAIQDFFIYRVPLSRMDGRPSLTRLPHPGPSCNITGSVVGILRCNDNHGEDMDADYSGGCTLRSHGIAQQHYVIAALRRSKGSRDYTRFDLHRFDSREGKWITKVLQLGYLEPSPGLTFFYHDTHKVIAMGGGLMGWVDLCRGILFCNVLADHPELHYIPLPISPDADSEMPEASAGAFRDIVVVQDHIRYVEHQSEVEPYSYNNGTYISKNWSVTIWTRKFTSTHWQGRWTWLKRDGSDVSGSLTKLLDFKETAALPQLQRLHTGHPIISLDEDDVVYILAKVDHREDNAFVLAVNLRDGTLQAADYFDAKRTVGISFTYTQYRTSGPLDTTPGKMEKKKRPGLLLLSSTNKK